MSKIIKSSTLLKWQLPIAAVAIEGIEPNAETQKKIFEKAHLSGFEKGFEAGYIEGKKKFDSEIDACRQQSKRVTQEMQKSFFEWLESLEPQLLDMILLVSRSVVRQELRLSPQQIAPVVKEALGMLPKNTQAVRLRLHPDDIALVEQQEFTILPDASLTPGGCVVETDFTCIDASIESRWTAVMQQINILHDQQ